MKQNKFEFAESILRKIVRDNYPESLRNEIEIKSEMKEEIDKSQKGYAYYQLVVDETISKDTIQSMIDVAKKEKMMIAKAGLLPELVYGEYIANDPTERSEAKTKLIAIRLVLELNEGDYDRLANVLSDAEEEGMRTQPSPYQQWLEEKREEEIETRRNGGIRPRHLM